MFSPKTALFSAVLSFEKGILREADAVLAFAEALVDFGGENAEHFFLDLVVVEEQREEILILRETFYESVVNAVEVGELEILFGVVFRARTQLVGLEHEVADLEHCFDGDIVVVAFPGAAVDLGDYDGKPLLLILGSVSFSRFRFFSIQYSQCLHLFTVRPQAALRLSWAICSLRFSTQTQTFCAVPHPRNTTLE